MRRRAERPFQHPLGLSLSSGQVDQLLRWHFRQAVLANMRGAGEPVFENEFPPGSDMAGEIRNGFKPAESMESELFSRLAVHSAGAWCWCGMVIFYHVLAINNPVQGEGAGVSAGGG